MTTALLDLPTAQDDRVREPLQLAERASALTVTRETKVHAEELILALNDAEKAVRKVLDPICESAHATWKKATGQRGELLKPIEEARAHLKAGCSTVQRELEAEAEAEARRRADEQAKQERERLQAEAEAAFDAGDVDEAMDVLEQADDVVALPASVMKTEPPKAAGITYRDNWIPQWVDAQGRPRATPDVRVIPIEYLKVDEVAIGRVVAAMKARTTIAGVKPYNHRQPVGTARR